LTDIVFVSARWKKHLRQTMGESQPAGQCQRCGACCAFISIPPFREDELDRLPIEIQQIVDWYTRNDPARVKSPVPCYFYDIAARACLIHEHKPQTCRDFEPGGLACRKQRSDLLGPLNSYYDATGEWAKHYTRRAAPGGRIQQMAEFRRDDVVEGVEEEAQRPPSHWPGIQ
jgi:Fe-S-cluster containining protein